jgi:hypothetical protein
MNEARAAHSILRPVFPLGDNHLCASASEFGLHHSRQFDKQRYDVGQGGMEVYPVSRGLVFTRCHFLKHVADVYYDRAPTPAARSKHMRAHRESKTQEQPAHKELPPHPSTEYDRQQHNLSTLRMRL